jgi:hypothetical protein
LAERKNRNEDVDSEADVSAAGAGVMAVFVDANKALLTEGDSQY